VPAFPLTAWRYHLRLEVTGSDVRNLPDALEEEDLALFRFLPREKALEQIREGLLEFRADLDAPLQAFPEDLAILSLYLFQVVKGIEVAQRYVSPSESDDARAWKVLARRGEWVKVPLRVGRDDEGGYHVDEDADDLEVISARWATYPLWFQDGMRRKHPTLRAL
jgi:hypothetical protein